MTLTSRKAYKDEMIPSSSNKLAQWLKLNEFQPERAMTSHFVSTKTLFLIRVIFAVYSLIVLWVDIIYTAQFGEIRHFFVYFTDMTFIGLHAYLIVEYVFKTFTDVPSIYSILTPVVFWSLLSKERLFEAHLSPIDFWVSISLHTVTLFILLVEVLLNRMTVNIRIVLLVFITLLLYMGLVFIVFASEQWWVYPFLDWSGGPSVIVWYLLVSFLTILCFFFQFGLHVFRDKMVEIYWIKRSKDNRQPCASEHWESSTAINQSSGFYPLSSSILIESSIEPSNKQHM
ncbi:hypothetical protein BD560DRAFT_477244 [Blakeslea trispora]|nr:hypothetical protein BD560DRAFT_477244 [Blakeslea trispora]